MILNKKGMSLMELLISIVLISIVLMFIFQLLLDLRNETSNNNFAYNNQINRTELIYTIQNDLKNYTLQGIDDVSNDNIEINFYYKNGDAKLYTEIKKDRYYFRYISVDKEQYSWEMKGARIDPCGLFVFYKDNLNYYFKINFYLYNNPLHDQNNEDKNNAVDDIEITYVGNSENLNSNDSNSFLANLTDKPVYKKIGTCTNQNVETSS